MSRNLYIKLYQGMITKWSKAFVKLTVFLGIGLSTIGLVKDKGPKVFSSFNLEGLSPLLQTID